MLLLQTIATPISAQKKSFDDVLKVTLNSKGAIMNGTEVSGYYLFYAVDKAEKGKMNYLLKILDNNLNQVASKSITDEKGVLLMESVYNGKSLMLKFYKPSNKDKEFTYRQYDMTGERKSSKTRPGGRLDYAMLAQNQGNDDDGTLPTLFPVPGKGFINYILDTEKGAMSQSKYIIEFMPEDEATGKAWKASSSPSSEMYESASFLACDEDILLSTTAKRKGAMNKDIEYYLLGTDMNTGDQLFETSVEDSKYAIAVTNGTSEGDKIQLYGLYYEKNAKTAKEKSLGIFAMTLDKTGKVLERHYNSWAKDVSKFLPTNDKGKIEDVGYLYFHQFIKSADGTIFAIAESYRRTADAGGIAAAVLSGGRTAGAGVTKIVIEDFYLFQFSTDFTIKDVKVIEKNKSDFAYPGTDYMSISVMGIFVKYLGGFDYSFLQKSNDKSLFTIGYLDYEKRKGEKDGYLIGTLNYVDNEWVNDKIKLSSSSTSFSVLPGKPGYVMVFEYFKKEKKMDVRLEKLNI